MWTVSVISILVNVVLGVTLLSYILYPRFIQKYRTHKNLKKARQVKALREEVRRYLDEIRNE